MDKLERMFDFQKYEKNAHLQSIIDDSMSRYVQELSDDMLEEVSAAGTPEAAMTGRSKFLDKEKV